MPSRTEYTPSGVFASLENFRKQFITFECAFLGCFTLHSKEETAVYEVETVKLDDLLSHQSERNTKEILYFI